MGSGLAGGPLTGGPAAATSVIAPAGQSAVISSPLGAGASDVAVKIGSTVADGAVNAAAVLAEFLAGINGTEVVSLTVLKSGKLVGGAASLQLSTAAGAILMYSTASLALSSTIVIAGSGAGNIQSWTALNGLIGILGTDSSGSPGNAAISRPSGKSAIALGASSVVITNTLVSVTSRVMITPQSRDATCKELIAVPGAGSFTVSGSANATAAVVFAWEVTDII